MKAMLLVLGMLVAGCGGGGDDPPQEKQADHVKVERPDCADGRCK